MYKVERKPQEGIPYEVMLSPFNTKDEAECYIEKYSKYYPLEEQVYIVTEI